MKKQKAFTLIELLVVVAIIALLLSIIIPALKRVKQQASGAVCLSNVRQLTVAWQTYSSDHNGQIPNGHVPRTPANVDPSHRYWVHYPQTDTGVCMGEPSQVRLEYELNGIRKGVLYPYLEATDVYHCPGEQSKLTFRNTEYINTKPWWNSYSITGMMNAEEMFRNGSNPPPVGFAVQMSDIVNPGGKVVFMENVDDRGWNMGSWLMNFANVPTWIDPIAIWHKDRSTLGFADGHAEMHGWVDQTTIENAETGHAVNTAPAVSESGNDIRYMQQVYVPGRR